MRAWQLAHTGLARCCSSISRTDAALPVLLSSRLVFTSGGGGGTGAARMFSSSHLPRMVGEVRVGYDVTASTLALPSRPQRFSSVERHAAEVAAVDAGNAVVPGQLFVQERVVRRSADRRCCGPPSADRRGTAPSPCTKAVRRLSSNQGNFRFASGVSSQTLRVCSHWPKKLLDQRRARARIGEHAPHLPLEDVRLLQLAAESPGRAVRRPGCCSTGRTTGARPARRRRDDRLRPARPWSGSASIRNRKSGLTSSRSSAARMPASKSPSARARRVEAEQRLDVLAGRRPAIRASSQRRQNLRRARRLLGPVLGGLARRRCGGGWANPAARGRCTARQSAATRSTAGRSGRRTRGSRSECAPVPAPRRLTRSDLTMVAITWRRPAFSGTRDLQRFVGVAQRILRPDGPRPRAAAVRSAPPPIVNCPTRAPSTRISISFGTFRPRITSA